MAKRKKINPLLIAGAIIVGLYIISRKKSMSGINGPGVPSSLQSFANKYGLIPVSIRYRHAGAGTYQKGFTLISRDGLEQVSFEPTGRKSDAWMIHRNWNKSGLAYAKNIREAIKKVEQAGFYVSPDVSYRLRDYQQYL